MTSASNPSFNLLSGPPAPPQGSVEGLVKRALAILADGAKPGGVMVMDDSMLREMAAALSALAERERAQAKRLGEAESVIEDINNLHPNYPWVEAFLARREQG